MITGVPRAGRCVEPRVRRALARLAARSIAETGDIANPSNPLWVKITKTFTDFAAAATTNTITLYTMPQEGVLQVVMAHHTTAFNGGAIATYVLSVGVTAAHTKYTPGAGTFNVFGAPGTGPNITSATNQPDCLSITGGTWLVTVSATSSGANLNAATQGSCDFWLLVSTAP